VHSPLLYSSPFQPTCRRISLSLPLLPKSTRLTPISDPTDIFSGDLSIGETITSATNVSIDLSSITNQPKLDVTIVSTSQTGNQHFQVLLDTDGLYGPDNKTVTVETDVDSTKNDKQLTAVVDTGFSLSQLPSYVRPDCTLIKL
jgi:hypothetical protein